MPAAVATAPLSVVPEPPCSILAPAAKEGSSGSTGAAAVAAALPWKASDVRRLLGGDLSEGPSESSVPIEDTEDDDFQSNLPNIERFYEQWAAKAKLPEHPGNGASSSWVLSLARSYRRLSKDKRRRGRLRALLQAPLMQPAGQGGLSAASGSGLPRPMMEQTGKSSTWSSSFASNGWSSNTDDSGYEGGYETDADESELSEWESGTNRQGHKRKLEALVHLTMCLSFQEPRKGEEGQEEQATLAEATQMLGSQPVRPLKVPKVPRMVGTQPVGLRLSLPRAVPDGTKSDEPAVLHSGATSSEAFSAAATTAGASSRGMQAGAACAEEPMEVAEAQEASTMDVG